MCYGHSLLSLNKAALVNKQNNDTPISITFFKFDKQWTINQIQKEDIFLEVDPRNGNTRHDQKGFAIQLEIIKELGLKDP